MLMCYYKLLVLAMMIALDGLSNISGEFCQNWNLLMLALSIFGVRFIVWGSDKGECPPYTFFHIVSSPRKFATRNTQIYFSYHHSWQSTSTTVIEWDMMTSSHGNIFRVTGHLCGEFTGPLWIPLTKASDAELWCFLWSALEINDWVNNGEAGDLRRNCSHYDVIVMDILQWRVVRHIEDISVSVG